MKVTEYLKRFLTEQPTMEAAVPGLGVFYAGQKDGKSCILFKEVVPNDKAFLNSIAFEENMTEEEVRQEMEAWVRELLQELKDKGMVNMEGVGSFVIEQDRVNYNPFVAQGSENDANFGLETPTAPAAPAAPEAPVRPEPVAAPEPAAAQPERKVLPPINRPQRQPRPNNIGKPQPRTAPNAGGSAKGIRLENAGNRPAGPQGRPVRPERSTEEPFYTRWWFIALCAVVVLLVLMFSVTPIRRDVLGIGAEPKAVQMGDVSMSEEEFEEALAEMLFGEEMAAAVTEVASAAEKEMTKKAEETKAVEKQIIAGEKEKKEAEKAAKASPQPLATTKPAAKPEAKPAAKTEAKPVAKEKPAGQKAQSDVAVVKPQPGRFYIIVGGFRDESNAFGHAKKMRESGLGSTVLYNEEKSIYYVSVKTCVTREEAMAARTDVRDNRKMDCWIYTK